MRQLFVIGFMSLLTLYVWWRLVRTPKLRGGARIAVTAALLACILPMLVVQVLGRGGSPVSNGPQAWPVFIGWVVFALLFAGVLVTDIVRGVVWIGRRALRSPPMDPSRRQALARITAGAIGTAVVTHVGVGLTQALGDAEVVDVPVTLPTLPRALDGLTIVQLTDLHMGGTIGRDYVQDVVDRANALNPDVLVLTGDFVDGSVDELRDVAAPLAALRAKYGVYFVNGNHEKYAGVEAWVAHFRSLGMRVLRNERVTIGTDGASFDLAGVEDYSLGPDVARALAGRDTSRPVVLLAHQPRQVHEAAKHAVDLQLSGHTHGGQVWPWHYLVSIQQGGFVAGRYTVGPTQLYVSRGPGYWGPPVRVGAPKEITRVILRASVA